ncbi:MAG: hypothetical protein HWE22_10625 [Flavobacteriales bacterium]|nr:hypothetical protein [Flavobacteriales bacterium]
MTIFTKKLRFISQAKWDTGVTTTMNEPEGYGTGGTMASTISGGTVMMELQSMTVEMVKALLQAYWRKFNLDFEAWKTGWMI